MNRKERERLFKKQEILDAAIKIFATKGFKATTLDEIAEKSEFGKGTIYNYFSNKEEIYKEIIIYISDMHKNNMYKAEQNTETFYPRSLLPFVRAVSRADPLCANSCLISKQVSCDVVPHYTDPHAGDLSHWCRGTRGSPRRPGKCAGTQNRGSIRRLHRAHSVLCRGS